MKLQRLDLIAVGPFTNLELDFSTGDYGLHIVFGPNEAGKSSSLRALHALLYDFHPRTADNFLHDYKKLRVGGLFAGRNGEQLHCVRYKGNKRTLREAQSDQPLDEQVLRKFLAGVNAEQFKQRFGLDHDQLRAGCASLRAGEGDLAEALFSAGAGLGDVHQVVEAVRREAAEIYKPSGRNQRIPQALDKYHAAEDVVRQSLQSAPHWKQREEQLAGLRDDFQQLERDLSQCISRLGQLDRIRMALPEISQRKHLLSTVAELKHVPLVAEDFARRRVSATTQLEEATRSQQELRKILEEINEQLAGVSVEAIELAREAEISQLSESLGAYRTGQGDRPALAAKLDQLDADARHLLRELGHGEMSFEDARKLHIDRITRERIQNLAQQHTLLENKRGQLQEQVTELTAELERMQQEADNDEPPATESLADLVQQIRGAGDLEGQRETNGSAMVAASAELASRLKRFAPWQGDLTQLAETAVPSEETIRRHEQELAAAAERKNSQQEKLAQTAAALDVLQEEIDSLSRQHDLPTEDDLAQVRRSREQAWQGIRSRWLGETPPAEAALPKQDVELAQQYETLAAEADLLGDRLRREAKQVAMKAGKLIEREKLLAQQERLVGQLAEAEQQLAAKQANWRQAWSTVGIEPLTPREMLSWSIERTGLLSAAESHARQVVLQQQLEQQIATWQERLVTALLPFEDERVEPPANLIGMLRHADRLVKRLEDQRRQQQEARRDLDKAKATLEKNRQKLEELRAACSEANEAWRAMLSQFEIPPAATAAEATGLLETLDEFFRKRREAEELAARIAGIDQRAEQFATDAAALAREIDLELLSLEPAEIAGQLQQRLKAAHAQTQRKDSLAQQLTREQERLADVAKSIRKHEADLHTLCQEAACERVDQLAAIEQESCKRREAEAELKQTESHLATLAQGARLEEFLALVDEETADHIPAEIDRLQTSQKAWSERRDELLQQINTLEQELRTATGGDRAALAEETVKAELANLAALAEDFARLKLAESVLLQAMQRYRQQNQGPILGRASEYFALLTLGSFSRLEPDWNDNGEAVLVGVRADGTSKVTIDGMSSGSMDQLYLALRLASLEHHLRESEPIPLVVDDILIHFDNARAAAALRALAEISRHTQVIMFTHHRHLVELARETLDQETLFVQELPSPLAAAKTHSQRSLLS